MSDVANALAYLPNRGAATPPAITMPDAPPEDMFQPAHFMMAVEPMVVPERTSGGLYLPQQTQEETTWFAAVGRIVALGPLCFEAGLWAHVRLPEQHRPKVGDLILFNAKSPNRFIYKKRLIVLVNDDAWFSRLTEDQARGFTFNGMSIA